MYVSGKPRVMGYQIQQLSDERNITHKELSELLECEEWQIKALVQGRVLMSFKQLSKLANLFNTPVSDLIHGDVEQYNKYMTDCVGHFSNNNNRETILNLIDDYVDLLSS